MPLLYCVFAGIINPGCESVLELQSALKFYIQVFRFLFTNLPHLEHHIKKNSLRKSVFVWANYLVVHQVLFRNKMYRLSEIYKPGNFCQTSLPRVKSKIQVQLEVRIAGNLALNVLDKNISGGHFEIFFRIFPGKRILQNVKTLFFRDKKNIINLLFAEFAHSMLTTKYNIAVKIVVKIVLHIS